MMSLYNNLYRSVAQQFTRQLLTVQHQHRAASLYAAASLGIDKYAQAREKVKSQFTGMADKFRTKMSELTADGANMVFTEDLKTMVHLGNKDDLHLLNEMIIKFHKKNKEVRFGSFVFGPVFMRLYHYLDVPDVALEAFESPECKGFFDQLMSYQILMDLLFKHEMYKEVLQVFDYVIQKQTAMMKYPKHIVVLAMATYYKQNTKESFENAAKLWKSLMDIGHFPMRRAVTFFAGLALKNGAPHVSLEVISTVKQQQYVTVRNIKVVALCDLDRAVDALPLLRASLNVDVPTDRRNNFLQETIDHVQASVERANNNDLKREFSSILKALQDQNLIDTVNTIDSLLCQEIQPAIMLDRGDGLLHNSFQNRRNNRTGFQREGLSQLS